MRVGVALLGAHVLHRADQVTDTCALRGHDSICVGRPRDTEVDDLRLAGRVHHDIGRLKIAVDDPLLVPMVDGVTGLGEQPQSVVYTELLIIGVRNDALRPWDVLHGEVRHTSMAIVVHAGLIDLSDVRVPQARQDLRFELKPPQGRA